MKIVQGYSGDEKAEIKYDLKDKKRFWVAALVCSVVPVISIFLLALNNVLYRLESVWEAMLVVWGVIFSTILGLSMWGCFLSCLGYLNRLKKHGYQVPADKKMYQGRLVRLERMEAAVPVPKQHNRESMTLAAVSLITAVCFLGVSVYIWQAYPDNEFPFGCMLGMVACWLLLGFYYWRQRISSKYRDDVEPGDTRKVRQNVVNGLITIVVCILLSVLYSQVIYAMADVIYKSRVHAGWY